MGPESPGAPSTATAQPKGLRYFLGTWSGRLLLLNTLVFVFICIKTGSILMPDTETLLLLGAKDPVKLAQGQLWRLITPIFIHIGIIHFAFNSYFLYAVGYQLERMLGGTWFLLVYLVAGLAGNTASSVWSMNLSAGASSSLFGLLGAGMFLERSIGKKILQATGRRPQNRAYLMTVVINLGIGIIIPFVDNSAHVGGLIGGTAMTFAMVNLRRNTLQPPRRVLGTATLAVLAALIGAGAFFGSSPKYVLGRIEKAGDASDDPDERIFHYTQALSIDPASPDLHLKRARELFAEGEANYALHDVRAVLALGEGHGPELEVLAAELESKGHPSEAWEIRRLVAHGGQGL